jgi:hypothetical protein
MAHPLGGEITSLFRLKDEDGNVITGGAGALTIASQVAPTGGSFGDVVVAETATPGTYIVRFTPTGAAGTYFLSLEHPTARPREYNEEWDVDPATAAGATTTVVTSYGVSLQRLRRDVGRRLGDLQLTTATNAGATDTWIDTVRLTDPAKAYVNRTLLITSGTAANLGEHRRVQGSTAGGTLTLQSALPAATAAGDQGELWNDRSQGWLPDLIKDILNQNIRNAAPLHLVELTSDLVGLVPVPGTGATLDAGVTLPAEYVGFYAVEYADGDGNYQPIRKQQSRGGYGFRLETNGKLVIGGASVWDVNGGTVRIFGYGHPAELSDDDDTTTVNAEWLVERTRADLLIEAGFHNRLPEAQRDAQIAAARADALRGRIRTIPKPNTVWVR